MRPEKDTIQATIRFEKETLRRLSEIAEHVGTDKAAIIKEAVQNFIDDYDEEYGDTLIRDYLQLRANDETLKEFFSWKEIPHDLKKAREKRLEELPKKEVK